ncbi:MAG: hypothetical protein AB1508_05305 [Pseudomonadota bacterium]
MRNDETERAEENSPRLVRVEKCHGLSEAPEGSPGNGEVREIPISPVRDLENDHDGDENKRDCTEGNEHDTSPLGVGR